MLSDRLPSNRADRSPPARENGWRSPIAAAGEAVLPLAWLASEVISGMVVLAEFAGPATPTPLDHVPVHLALVACALATGWASSVSISRGTASAWRLAGWVTAASLVNLAVASAIFALSTPEQQAQVALIHLRLMGPSALGALSMMVGICSGAATLSVRCVTVVALCFLTVCVALWAVVESTL